MSVAPLPVMLRPSSRTVSVAPSTAPAAMAMPLFAPALIVAVPPTALMVTASVMVTGHAPAVNGLAEERSSMMFAPA